jgi:hypothetical protein
MRMCCRAARVFTGASGAEGETNGCHGWTYFFYNYPILENLKSNIKVMKNQPTIWWIGGS